MIAIDTNVLVYAYDESSPTKREKAREILLGVRDGVLLWQVACEFVAASRKTLPRGADPSIAWERLDEIRGVLRFVAPQVGALELAARIHKASRAQLWDCLLYAACIEQGIPTLLSEDVPGSRIEGLVISNPFVA